MDLCRWGAMDQMMVLMLHNLQFIKIGVVRFKADMRATY